MSVSDACLAEQLAVNDGLTDIELVTSVQSALLANLQHLRGSYSNAISVKAKRKRRKQTKAKRQFIQFFFFFFFFSFQKDNVDVVGCICGVFDSGRIGVDSSGDFAISK
jgi:hypothetical protein